MHTTRAPTRHPTQKKKAQADMEKQTATFAKTPLKSTQSHSIELRVPFFTKHIPVFMHQGSVLYVMTIGFTRGCTVSHRQTEKEREPNVLKAPSLAMGPKQQWG